MWGKYNPEGKDPWAMHLYSSCLFLCFSIFTEVKLEWGGVGWGGVGWGGVGGGGGGGCRKTGHQVEGVRTEKKQKQ